MQWLPENLRLGVSPLSWANDVLEDLGADIPLEQCLREAANAGYEGIELGRKFPKDPEVLHPLLQAQFLDLASGWYSGELAERSVEDEKIAVMPHARMLRALGCEVMVYGEVAMMAGDDPLNAPMSTRRQMPREEFPAYAQRLTEFAKHLQDRWRLRLVYHHHLMMVAETFDEVSTLFDATGPECGLLLDTGHAVAAGFDYTRLIERFGDRIAHIHLKDMRADQHSSLLAQDASFNDSVRAGLFTVPGDGIIDFAPVARFARDGGYEGWLIVEAEQDPAVAPLPLL